MASRVGRNVKIYLNDVLVAGVRTRALSIDNAPIDVTTADSAGFRELLDISGERDVKGSIEGLTKDTDILEAAAAGSALIRFYDIELYPNFTLSGDFRISNIVIGAEYNDAVAFTADLDGTGSFFSYGVGTQMVWQALMMKWQISRMLWA
jgi:predicted secreted protein